jgi:hypothetical protein
MPSLNVTFTDEELEEVRAAAAAEGKSLRTAGQEVCSPRERR